MSIPDRELETSPLGGAITRDGQTVMVHIYQFAGTEDEWTLEVVDIIAATSPRTRPSRPN
jgi:hypothetical protein